MDSKDGKFCRFIHWPDYSEYEKKINPQRDLFI